MERAWFVAGAPAPSRDPVETDEGVFREVAARYGDDVADTVRLRWLSIRSYNLESRRGIRSLYNVRLDLHNPREHIFSVLDTIFKRQGVAFKINASVGLILRHKTTKALRYFHPSDNNARVLNAPVFVNDREAFLQLKDAFDPESLRSSAAARCPDSTWSLVALTNIAVYVYHHMHHPIGAGEKKHRLRGCFSPRPLLGAPNLCFFQCLYTHLQRRAAAMKLVRLAPHQLLKRWRPNCLPRDFQGVTDEDLPSLEREYKLNIYVYTLNRSGDRRCAVLLRRPLEVESQHSRLELHRHDGHYSLILDMDSYANCFKCRHCGQVFTRKYATARHEAKCLAMTRRSFKGGPFTLKKNVFEQLEDCGVPLSIPEDRRFYPFRATYDIETFQQSAAEGSGAGVLSSHVLMSVSVASNVPGYEMPQCFISDGDPLDLTRRFLQHLGRISCEAERLVKKDMAPLLDDIAISESVERMEKSTRKGQSALKSARLALERWMGTLPCFAFNGSKYDLIVLKPYIAKLWSDDCLPQELNVSDGRDYAVPGASFVRDMKDFPDDFREEEACASFFLNECEEATPHDGDDLLEDILREHEEAQETTADPSASARPCKARKKSHLAKLVIVAKSSSNIVSMVLGNLLFLDVCSYLAPGVNYSRYLKAFGIDGEQEGKSYFPYDYVDSLDRLKETSLPPYEAFYSRLRRCNVLDEGQGEAAGRGRHEDLLKLWNAKGMRDMSDFLAHYNNADVVPFLQALEKQAQVYRGLQLDMSKDAVTLPGLAMKYSFRKLGGVFHTFTEGQGYLHDLVMGNIVGGPSIVFKRWAEAEVTRIRPLETLHGEAELCKSIIGLDCNGLYLYALSLDMPTGRCIVRKAPDFLPEDQHSRASGEGHSKASQHWLRHLARTTGRKIRHSGNGREVRLGLRNIPVDGFDHEQGTVYQFHGCLHHGCPCLLETQSGLSSVRLWEAHTGVTHTERREKTRELDDYLRNELGYDLVVMKQCEWERFRKDNLCFETNDAERGEGLPAAAGARTASEILDAVRRGELFGLCLVDIAVPPNLRQHFAEMPPIFKKAQVARQHIGPLMAQFAAERDILRKPRTMLISSYFGEKILLATPLLKWYLEQGLAVTAVHLVMQYEPMACFDDLVNTVTQARRAADKDRSQAILGDTHKLIGNAVFGKTGECKSRREQRVFATLEEARTYVNRRNFRDIKRLSAHVTAPVSGARRGSDRSAEIEELPEAGDSPPPQDAPGLDFCYEVVLGPRKIVEDLPLHIAFFVYQYAKLRMLELRYEFMERYFDKAKWEQLYMDTDSNYMACSVHDLEDALIPERRREYFERVHHWLPTPVCDIHRASFVECKVAGVLPWRPRGPCCENRLLEDNRTPGLFKTEWQGSGLVALCSKTYFGQGDENKLSCKGLQKSKNDLAYATYKSVLTTGVSAGGTNSGFRCAPDGRVVTYEQDRDALGYFYGKRVVHEDGVHTSPLLL